MSYAVERLLFACLCTCFVVAWYENDVYGGKPARRSRWCVADGYMCLKTDQCCGKKSICVVKKEPNQENTVSSSLGICMNIYKYPKGVVGQKEEGERCDTSYECASGCCRHIQRHRYGSMQLCGEPGHYTCIFKEYSSNDIDNNY
ncbi:hypothetical protein CHS0354_033353 [Potamilus streckersoni]|uniref:Uncharacterized protein n=1 Tax=Potamilus streckersoni TaxID=2493646 RepID=A0AAE0RTJ5_9BIVA|nr:hypothetical protein CHS0354_033353 [Potamilus streckersoni]